jgi:hypothetical protein
LPATEQEVLEAGEREQFLGRVFSGHSFSIISTPAGKLSASIFTL